MLQTTENWILWPREIATEDTTSIGMDVHHRPRAAIEHIEIATARDTNHRATVAEAEVGAQGGIGRLTMEGQQVER